MDEILNPNKHSTANDSKFQRTHHRRHIATDDYRSDFLFHGQHTHASITGNSTNPHENTILEFNPKPNMEKTKFHQGFHRRHISKVENPLLDQQRQFEKLSQERKEKLADIRREEIRLRDRTNGFNVLTNEPYKETFKESKAKGIRMITDPISQETFNKARIILREDPLGRYHAPFGHGEAFQKRQERIMKDGVFAERYTSILQLGKKDLVSYGIEDQLSKSEYMKNNEVTRNGLYETRKLGSHWLQSNPSANKEIVKKWASSIDLNNNALKGKL